MPDRPMTTRDRVDRYISQAQIPMLECRLNRHQWPGLYSGDDNFVQIVPDIYGNKKVVEWCERECDVHRSYKVNPVTGVVTEKPRTVYPPGYLWVPEAGGDGYRMGTAEWNLLRAHLLAERERRLASGKKTVVRRTNRKGVRTRTVPMPRFAGGGQT